MKRRYLTLLLLVLTGGLLQAQPESSYITALARHLDGKEEVRVVNGRVDIVTAEYAIEVERAANWKNSIGQALWYGLQTSKRPGIILIVKSSSEWKYAQQLQSSIDYAGMTDELKVWVYPEDFPGVNVDEPQAVVNTDATLTYWLNAGSNKRHTSKCKYYGKTSKGRYCTVDEGEPAGCCN